LRLRVAVPPKGGGFTPPIGNHKALALVQ
jgi:hypothetical protein